MATPSTVADRERAEELITGTGAESSAAAARGASGEEVKRHSTMSQMGKNIKGTLLNASATFKETFNVLAGKGASRDAPRHRPKIGGATEKEGDTGGDISEEAFQQRLAVGDLDGEVVDAGTDVLSAPLAHTELPPDAVDVSQERPIGGGLDATGMTGLGATAMTGFGASGTSGATGGLGSTSGITSQPLYAGSSTATTGTLFGSTQPQYGTTGALGSGSGIAQPYQQSSTIGGNTENFGGALGSGSGEYYSKAENFGAVAPGIEPFPGSSDMPGGSHYQQQRGVDAASTTSLKSEPLATYGTQQQRQQQFAGAGVPPRREEDRRFDAQHDAQFRQEHQGAAARDQTNYALLGSQLQGEGVGLYHAEPPTRENPQGIVQPLTEPVPSSGRTLPKGVPSEDVTPYTHLKSAMQDELLGLQHPVQQSGGPGTPLIEPVLKPSEVHSSTAAQRAGPKQRLELGSGTTVQPTYGGDFEVRKPVHVVEEKSQWSDSATGVSGKQTDSV